MIIPSEFEENERVEDEIDLEHIEEDTAALEEDAQYKNPPQW